MKQDDMTAVWCWSGAVMPIVIHHNIDQIHINKHLQLPCLLYLGYSNSTTCDFLLMVNSNRCRMPVLFTVCEIFSYTVSPLIAICQHSKLSRGGTPSNINVAYIGSDLIAVPKVIEGSLLHALLP